MSRLNSDTYNDPSVVKWYDGMSGLTPVEQQVFERHELALKNVLDIGIGAGRTTAYLLNKCGSYTGIDYSQRFVELAGQKFPGADIRHIDARNLEAFAAGSFDLVNFSFNGMDYVDAEGRKAILSEIYRVLKPAGLFFFSTHNKSHSTFGRAAWRNPANSLWINIKTFLKLMPYFLTHLKHKKSEYIETDFAIINDSAHHYSLLTFYTTPFFLRQQLEEKGFRAPVLYSKSGDTKPDDELDDWIFATAIKSLT